MYTTLLYTHSWTRWLVLIFLLVILIKSYYGWFARTNYKKSDKLLRISTTAICHMQLSLGIYLYCISPITNYFIHNFKEAINLREIRFFGMEHSSMMLLAVIVISIGSSKSKKQIDFLQKHKTIAIWFTIGLLIVLSSIPWSFSPLISRPLFR